MDWRGNKGIIFLMLFGLLTISAFPQEDERSFDRDLWEKLSRDMEYSEDPPQQVVNEPAQLTISPVVKTITQALVILALGAMFIFFIYKLLAGKYGWNKKIKNDPTQIISDLEEELPEAELDIHLNAALKNGDYRLAIRIYYLKLIQTLTDKNFIRWTKEKTNLDYLLETTQQAFHPDFRNLTTIFEIVWYGDKPIEKSGFEKLQPTFDNFLNRLNEKQ